MSAIGKAMNASSVPACPRCGRCDRVHLAHIGSWSKYFGTTGLFRCVAQEVVDQFPDEHMIGHWDPPIGHPDRAQFEAEEGPPSGKRSERK
jgi:hypothetical protein